MSQNLSDSYPEWVKQLVLPHQGDVVRMLPRPHTRYRLFPNAKQIGTIYGAICVRALFFLFFLFFAISHQNVCFFLQFGESVSDLKDVAVKITTWLHWEKTHTSSSECVLREIKHWHDLLHPASEAQLSLASPSQIAGLQHVIELIEVGYTDYEHWAVMPRARHGNLHDAIEEQARDSGFDELTAWEMFAQLLDSLDYVHFRGFAHLDVSLENCLLNENSDGEPFVLLCDFGQSRPMPRHGDSEAMFSINAPRGRKLYCSPPEYLVDSNSNFRYSGFRGSAVDVYAAGVILYSLLVSVYPFPNGATGSLYHSIFGQTAPSIVDREYFHRAEAGLRRLAYWHQNGSPYPGVDVFEGDSDVLNQEVIGSPLTLGAAEVLVRLLCWPEQRLTITQVRALPWMMQEPL
jgi:serine/threonine protein kinase